MIKKYIFLLGKEFQAIFSEVIEKPAHDSAMLSDDDDDEIEKEVHILLKDKSEYAQFSHQSKSNEPDRQKQSTT